MQKSKTYSNKDIESALKDITEKHISISQAAKNCNIPIKTLADRKNKRWNSDKVGHPHHIDCRGRKLIKKLHFLHGISCIPTQYKANKRLHLGIINKEWA